MPYELVLFKNIHDAKIVEIDRYVELGGYKAARKVLSEETCGQCTQCREGTWWMEQVLHRIEHGHGTASDLKMILDMCSNMKGVTICVLADACAMPVEAMINKYHDEFEYHVTHKRCMVGKN